MKKLLYLTVCVFIGISMLNCSGSNKNIQKEENKICELTVSYFDVLLKDIEYVLRRSVNGYMFDLKNDYRNYKIVVVEQPNNQFLYKEIFPICDTIFYDLSLKSEYFELRYGVEINRIEEIIHFCSKEVVIEISIREKEHYYFFTFPDHKILYRETEPTFDYDEKICENWYLRKKK
jgi:hypothetical protein